MNKIDKIALHKQICIEENELYTRKNHDYGDSFGKTFEEEGFAMARIRLSDKLERFKKLTRDGGQMVNDESIEDTLIDLANYAIMTVVEMRVRELKKTEYPVPSIWNFEDHDEMGKHYKCKECGRGIVVKNEQALPADCLFCNKMKIRV